MKTIRSRFLTILLSLLLIVAIGFSWGYYDYKSPGPLEAEKNVLLPKGSGVKGIVDILAKEGVIRFPLVFKAEAVISGHARKFKAGEYAFPAHVSPRAVIEALAGGKVVVHKLTVAEGLTSQEILDLLRATPLLEGELPERMDEGILLPETYYYSYGDARGEILSRMQKSMEDTVRVLWAKRDPKVPLVDQNQAVTLASIVEKETGEKEERGRVAAVFINRLRLGMKLQSDPTVSYGITQGKGKFDRLLTRADLDAPTEYNTYVIPGLPPGPIANPGRASLKAVMNPPTTDELYFVATGTGGHNFASTLKGHEANVKLYRKILKDNKK